MASTVLMSDPGGSGPIPPRWVAPDPAGGLASETAHAFSLDPERLVLDAAALRRRQLCVAFVHGSTRSWRVRRRIWPAALAGVLIVAVVIAALAVAGAFARQQDIDKQRQSAGWSEIGGEVAEHVLSSEHADGFAVVEHHRGIAALEHG